MCRLVIGFDKHLRTCHFFFTEVPDSVSMSLQHKMGPMVEGKKYYLECNITNVAPARNLSVHWYKGNEIFHTDSFNKDLGLKQFPVNLSSVINLDAHRDDNGKQIWCEAKLDFGPSEPNPPALQSKSHKVIVLCEFLMPSSYNKHSISTARILVCFAFP